MERKILHGTFLLDVNIGSWKFLTVNLTTIILVCKTVCIKLGTFDDFLIYLPYIPEHSPALPDTFRKGNKMISGLACGMFSFKKEHGAN